MAKSVTETKDLPFEKSLDSYLTLRGVDKKFISTYAKSIAALQSSGFKIIDVLDNGTPVPEWVLVKARIAGGDVGKLVDVFKIPKLRGVEIFPEGIINPELLLNIKLGNFKS